MSISVTEGLSSFFLKILNIAKRMPELRHSIPGQEFEIQNSEVVQWLIKQPEVLNYVWNNIKNSGAVTYNADTGCWRGIEYEN